MHDGFGRELNYLRLSVTDRCNLRCRYCMAEGVEFIPHEAILRYEEMLRLCGIFAGLGVRRFRVTGGEPLVRRGIDGFMEALKKTQGVEAISLTTNGLLLEDKHLKWVDSVNISLDTLDKKQYENLTGADGLGKVLKALRQNVKVKINCVVMKGINESQVVPLAALAEKDKVDVRFIEVMPFGAAAAFEPVPSALLLKNLRFLYPDLTLVSKENLSGPARMYHSEKLQGRIGFISPMSGHFCGECNRLRLSSTGFLRLCLYDEAGVDLKALLRHGASDEEIKQAILAAVLKKPERHGLGGDLPALNQIGG